MPSRHGDVCLNDPIDRSIDLSSSEVEIDMSEISTRGLPQLVRLNVRWYLKMSNFNLGAGALCVTSV